MMWQDLVFSTGTFVFIVALMPSFLGDDKPAVATSATTVAVLGAYTVAYVTLGLKVSAWSTFILAGLWAFLAWQKWRAA